MSDPKDLSAPSSPTGIIAARLNVAVEAAKMTVDLANLTAGPWAAQQTLTQTGRIESTSESKWTCLPLRSPAGAVERTDPGGPGIDDYKFTRLVHETPNILRLLTALPTQLRSVRLMSLAPSATVAEHRDTPTGLDFGLLRLHVPITTNPGAVLTIDGVDHCWQPGSLWYGDFSKPHKVANLGRESRVHLVIDCVVTPELLALFPHQFREQVSSSSVLFHRSEVPLHRAELTLFEGTCQLPESFLQLDEEVRNNGEPDIAANIDGSDGSLTLRTAGGGRYGLVHVGRGEFRLTGWIEERGLHLCPSEFTIRFFSRRGCAERSVIRPFTPTLRALSKHPGRR
ncbi:aspartyl/asparaginyl beta-hydroxylase domain-containing protein [Pseudonocardia sp. TMWB2A]|uniref:aspartyl/asparaginyl beta-hydroxylase domain-containing protein n=1 Tax=Pseudonocardia sp. TMWB2A TaxID=687430 RepID=UPI00307F344C